MINVGKKGRFHHHIIYKRAKYMSNKSSKCQKREQQKLKMVAQIENNNGESKFVSYSLKESQQLREHL